MWVTVMGGVKFEFNNMITFNTKDFEQRRLVIRYNLMI